MSIFWTDKRTDLSGSRWEVWERYYQDTMDWPAFKSKVIEFNPSLNNDSRWLFVKGWIYYMPIKQQPTTPEPPSPEIDFDDVKVRSRLIQQLLKMDEKYTGVPDGILKESSLIVISQYEGIKTNWTSEQKAIGFIQLKAKEQHIETGELDGYWGPQTEYAAELLYQILTKGKTEEHWRPEEINEQPSISWPKQYSEAFYSFFGEKGKNLSYLTPPYPHFLSWNTAQQAKKIQCHKKVKESLEKILVTVREHYGLEEIKKMRLDRWGGCFNDRSIRGGSKPSMHSWGIAMDYDPSNNKLRWGRDRAQFAKPEYNKWWQIWEQEGWVSLGRQRNFDWMHVQAARIY
ncbi:hypothetical protein SAMN06265379_108151 [Saccharicrinis carchari]|uniref:D-alanyl-D-alanine carboxypeptidase n=1 Tax=Saccharicrinis carchari TaxID=1168039 RepID=A0A521EDF9_SACCC|nr:M15 family metallopeptidase [Saccharicrinis carchari]SMO81954.1 hypothetical protein SAMN06265379_108151 [Saccharicrinis carchari]